MFPINITINNLNCFNPSCLIYLSKRVLWGCHERENLVKLICCKCNPERMLNVDNNHSGERMWMKKQTLT